MGKLEKIFGSFRRGRPDTEVLTEIEDRLLVDDIPGAMALLEELKKEQNIVIAIRLILRKIIKTAENENQSKVTSFLKQLLPYINGIKNERYRALLLGEAAIGFYLAGSEFEGDFTLKTAINLALPHPDVLRDILFNLIKSGLLQKAAYAMKLVREPEKLDVVLSYLAEVFYERGEVEKALAIVRHITSNFHRAVTLMHLAQLEEGRDREKALQLIESAIKIAEKIEDPDARFELMLKLQDLRHEIMGEPLSVDELLSFETPEEKRAVEDQGDRTV